MDERFVWQMGACYQVNLLWLKFEPLVQTLHLRRLKVSFFHQLYRSNLAFIKVDLSELGCDGSFELKQAYYWSYYSLIDSIGYRWLALKMGIYA